MVLVRRHISDWVNPFRRRLGQCCHQDDQTVYLVISHVTDDGVTFTSGLCCHTALTESATRIASLSHSHIEEQ